MNPNLFPRPRASSAVPSPLPTEPFWSRPLPLPTTTCLASDPPTQRAPSQLSVEQLLAHATEAETARLLAHAYSPLFPQDAPYSALADIQPQRAAKDVPVLNRVTEALARFKDSLAAAAGDVAEYLHYSEDDVRTLAIRLAHEAMPPMKKVEYAERLLGAPVPGRTLHAQLARLSDARFWRRALRVRILRAREHLFLRLGLIGKGREAYASQAAVLVRAAQLRRQDEWMKATVLIPRHVDAADGSEPYEPLTLDKVASNARLRFAKLYTFVKAVDTLAQDAGLSAAMVTLTLEPEWHANPSHGQNSWSGASPREAHQSLCQRWQAILRDLHRGGIRLSGLRVAEPHADACPHWHIWMLYRPEHEVRILTTVMKYFPNKLKVRSPSAAGGKHEASDIIYDNRAGLLAGSARAPSYAKEGAQVEMSRIDRSIGSGASYAMKYLLKTVDAGEAMAQEVGLFSARDTASEKKRTAHAQTAKRVDAYRSCWGLNQGQLFGIAQCLTVWDELRRAAFAPKHALLRKLWALARGSDKEGRIEAGTGIQGDAVGFLKALGGLDACRGKETGKRRLMLGRLLEEAVNGYGETVKRTKGVRLLLKERVQVVRRGVSRRTGRQTAVKKWVTATKVVASIRTHWIDWMLVPKRLARQVLDRAHMLEQHAIEQLRKASAPAASAGALSPMPS